MRPATTITIGLLLLTLLAAATLQIVFRVGGGTPTRTTSTVATSIATSIATNSTAAPDSTPAPDSTTAG